MIRPLDFDPTDSADTPDDAEIFSRQFAAETDEMNRCLDLMTDLAGRPDAEPPPPENFRPDKFRAR